MCAVANGWTDRLKELEEENRRLKEENRVLTMRLETAIRILDEIAEIGKRVN